eukprot:3498393-Lingulodinium_polyedra.AAC.1
MSAAGLGRTVSVCTLALRCRMASGHAPACRLALPQHALRRLSATLCPDPGQACEPNPDTHGHRPDCLWASVAVGLASARL